MTAATPAGSFLHRLLSVRALSLEFGVFGDFVGSGTDESREIDRSVDPVPDQPVRVSNVNGEVTVEPADSNRIEVTGTVRTNGRRASLDSVEVNVDRTPDGVVVEVDHEDQGGLFSFGEGVLVDLDVRVPESVPLAGVETVNGDLTVEDVAGDAHVESVNGQVRAVGVDGRVHLETVNGDVRAEGVRAIRRAESTNGSVDVAVEELSGDLVAETTTGQVTVRLPADTDCDLELDTSLGDSTVEGFDADAGSSGWGTHHQSVGEGGPDRVRVSTTTGSIAIRGR